MELQKLYKDKQELQRDKNMYDKRINALQDTLGVKAINYSSERVQGGMVRNSQEDAILQIADLQTLAHGIQKQIDAIDERINEAFEIAKEYGDKVPDIIKAKMESNAPNWVIAEKIGIGEATLYRKLKLMKENDRIMIEQEAEKVVK
jgi:hypothetical protein